MAKKKEKMRMTPAIKGLMTKGGIITAKNKTQALKKARKVEFFDGRNRHNAVVSSIKPARKKGTFLVKLRKDKRSR